jgi:flagellar basal-body rod modification protein FlgD
MIDNTVGHSPSFESLGLSQAPETLPESREELGQDDFLTLMTTQLRSQDPLNPMENEAFLSQIAQFSTVNGIEQLQSSFAGLASSLVSNQALQASQLVGRSVLVRSDVGVLNEEQGLDGSIELPATVPDLTLKVHDETGQLVRELSLAGQGPGLVDFTWDGFDDAGQALPPGRYALSAEGTLDDQAQSFDTFASFSVQSVTLAGDEGGLLLELGGLGQLSFNEVRQIR